MKLLLLFLFFTIAYTKNSVQNEFIQIKLNEPYEFPIKKAHANQPVKFEVHLADSPDTKALSIRIVDGFSHPPSCLQETHLNVTYTKQEVTTKPIWGVDNSCTSITSSTIPPFIPKDHYYLGFETYQNYEGLIIIVHNLE
eukprot:gene2355-2823_t